MRTINHPSPTDLRDGLNLRRDAPPPAQLAAVRQDQRRRWLAGQRVFVEAYLESVPELAADPEAVLDLIYCEFRLREEQGERPAADELLARFPQHADALRRQLDLHHGLRKDSAATRPLLAPSTDSEPALASTRPPREGAAFSFLAPAECGDEIGRLGGYRILRLLGKGGMGYVFEAEEQQPRRRVAVKVMKPEVASADHSRERFLREGQAAASLEHERIVPIYRVDEANGVPFLVMPFLRGESLTDHLKHDSLPALPEVLRIGREIAEGLVVAHKAGLVHRDIKPANIWLKEPAAGDLAAHVLLLDFGLARPEQPSAVLTQPGSVVGTAAYMAPEQARGEHVDGRSDLFSLGCVLYEMATGQRAFTGDDLIAIVCKIATEHPPPPSQVNPSLPPPLSDLVMRLLAKDPAGRPASACEVIEILRALERSPASVSTLAETSPWTVPAAPRRRWLLAAALLPLLAAVLLAVWRPWQTEADTNLPPPLLALKGDLDVFIYAPDDPARQNLWLNDSRALPLRPEDEFCIEASVNRPAYLYVLWIDAAGEVAPVYPWKPGHWEERPAEEQPVERLRRPEAVDLFYQMPNETGMQTLVLLARDTPLPREVDLKAELAGLPRQREQDLRATAWFENGELVRNDPRRMGKFEEKRREDPLLAAQQRIREVQQRHFDYSRSVSFASRGR